MIAEGITKEFDARYGRRRAAVHQRTCTKACGGVAARHRRVGPGLRYRALALPCLAARRARRRAAVARGGGREPLGPTAPILHGLPQRRRAGRRVLARARAAGRSRGASPSAGRRSCASSARALMPPPGEPQPGAKDVDEFVASLEANLDAAAATTRTRAGPRGRASVESHRVRDRGRRSARRRNRRARACCPPDAASDGFDNVADVLQVSPTHLDQYLARGARHQHPRRRQRAQPEPARAEYRSTCATTPCTSTACRSARATACSWLTTSRRTASTCST